MTLSQLKLLVMILLGLSGVYSLHIIIGYLFPGCLKVTVLYMVTSHLTFPALENRFILGL